MELGEHTLFEIQYALVTGLNNSEAKVKQYYLEKALHHLIGHNEFTKWKESEGWDSGIPA